LVSISGSKPKFNGSKALLTKLPMTSLTSSWSPYFPRGSSIPVPCTPMNMVSAMTWVWLPKFTSWKLNPQIIAFGCGTFGIRIRWGHKGGAPKMQASSPALSQCHVLFHQGTLQNPSNKKALPRYSCQSSTTQLWEPRDEQIFLLYKLSSLWYSVIAIENRLRQYRRLYFPKMTTTMMSFLVNSMSSRPVYPDIQSNVSLKLLWMYF
jgi:hypothetical protein